MTLRRRIKTIREAGELEISSTTTFPVDCHLDVDQEFIDVGDHDNPNDTLPGQKFISGEVWASDNKLALPRSLTCNAPISLRLQDGTHMRIQVVMRGNHGLLISGQIL